MQPPMYEQYVQRSVSLVRRMVLHSIILGWYQELCVVKTNAFLLCCWPQTKPPRAYQCCMDKK